MLDVVLMNQPFEAVSSKPCGFHNQCLCPDIVYPPGLTERSFSCPKNPLQDK